MKRLLLVLLLAGVPACAPPPTIQTPQGQAAYRADQIVLRINELQNAAIQANATKGLPEATTRTIVSFAVSANKTLKDAPNGWLATVTKAWSETKAKLPMPLDPSIAGAVTLVDTVLAFNGGGQ